LWEKFEDEAILFHRRNTGQDVWRSSYISEIELEKAGLIDSNYKKMRKERMKIKDSNNRKALSTNHNVDYVVQGLPFTERLAVEQSILSRSLEKDFKLRVYQTEAIDKILSSSGPQIIKFACGCGKTLITGHVLEKMQKPLVIVLAPLLLSVRMLQSRLMPFFR
jgi:superfamily II DNA or RNA helicase